MILLKSNLLRKTAAEAIGTFVIVFAGCGSIAVNARFPLGLPAVGIPVVFGIAVMIMIYALGHISGAHFNPAVTLAFAVARHFSWNEVGFYWAGQFFGSFLAVAALRFLLPSGEIFGATIPFILPLQALGIETLLTFILMFVIVSVATDTRAVGLMAGAAIGATVMLGAFLGGPLTGASMNPARSLAPNWIEGHLDVMWIYLAGPFLGTVCGALIYEWLRCDRTEKANRVHQEVKGCC